MEVIFLKEKINDIIERLFHLENEIAKPLYIEGGLTDDEWLKIYRTVTICIDMLNALKN